MSKSGGKKCVSCGRYASVGIYCKSCRDERAPRTAQAILSRLADVLQTSDADLEEMTSPEREAHQNELALAKAVLS